MAQREHFAKIFYSVISDDEFEGVYENDRALATWVRMLLQAEMMYPNPPPLPRMSAALQLLVERGLVLELPNARYTIRGLKAERDRRYASGYKGGVASGNARRANAERSLNERGTEDGRGREREIEVEVERGRESERSLNERSPTNGVFPASKPGLHDGRHGKTCLVCYPQEIPTVEKSKEVQP